MILCRSWAQWRHRLHGGGDGEPWGWREETQPSPFAAAPPGVFCAATQWPIYSPALRCCRLVTAGCNKHRKFTVCWAWWVSFTNMCAATEVLIERHLDDILNNNMQAVVGTFQTEIKNTVKALNRRKKASEVSCWDEISALVVLCWQRWFTHWQKAQFWLSALFKYICTWYRSCHPQCYCVDLFVRAHVLWKDQEKLRAATEVILSSSLSIVSCSSNLHFRNACLNSMKVWNVYWLLYCGPFIDIKDCCEL